MKAPPEHVEQITADRLREVIVGLKCPAPSNNELSEMAAAYAAMQLFDRDPKVELASEPGVSARNIVTGKVRVTNVPVHLRHVVARGATKHWKQKNWSDRAPDIAAPFRRAMKGVDPTCRSATETGLSRALLRLSYRLFSPVSTRLSPPLAKFSHGRHAPVCKRRGLQPLIPFI